MKKHLIVLWIGIQLLANAALYAQTQNVAKNNIAVQGYDVVAYFTDKVATKGAKQFSVSYQSATYYFANTAHLELFKKNPTKYAPAYGGWCAYAMGLNGSKVSINPNTFKIKNGKLLLFYNKLLINTLDDWNKNEEALYNKAEKNWGMQK